MEIDKEWVKKNYRNQKSFVISEGVEEIGMGAFEGCKFKNVSLPKSLTFIGYYAFRNCKNLEYIEIPKGTKIMSGAFEGCNSLSSVKCSIDSLLSMATFTGYPDSAFPNGVRFSLSSDDIEGVIRERDKAKERQIEAEKEISSLEERVISLKYEFSSYPIAEIEYGEDCEGDYLLYENIKYKYDAANGFVYVKKEAGTDYNVHFYKLTYDEFKSAYNDRINDDVNLPSVTVVRPFLFKDRLKIEGAYFYQIPVSKIKVTNDILRNNNIPYEIRRVDEGSSVIKVAMGDKAKIDDLLSKNDAQNNVVQEFPNGYSVML